MAGRRGWAQYWVVRRGAGAKGAGAEGAGAEGAGAASSANAGSPSCSEHPNIASACASYTRPTRSVEDEDAPALFRRLEAARAARLGFDDRICSALSALGQEEASRTDLQRRVDSAYERLDAQLRGTPGLPDPSFEGDVDVEEAEERLEMLQQRLAPPEMY